MPDAIAASSGVRLKSIEDGIEVVHRVAELVEAQVCVGLEPALFVERAFFEEATDRLAARQEVLLGGVQGTSIRGEDGCLIRRRHVFAGKLQRALAERKTALGRDEIRQHEKTVASKSRELCLGNPAARLQCLRPPAHAASLQAPLRPSRGS